MATTSERTLRISEREFMAQVIQLARLCKWKVYHTFDSRHSTPGFPDLVMVKPSCDNQPARLIFAELKSDKGRLTAEQAEWLEVLGQVPYVEAHCWKPGDWPAIVERLKAG